MVAAGYGVFIQDNKLLLARRCNTGYMDGYYGLPSGHIEDNEPITKGTLREMKEELGLELQENHIAITHIMHRKSNDIRIDFFYIVKDWPSEPTNTEPDRCDDLSWFPLDKLPENTIPYIKTALEHIHNKKFYSEFGWE